MLFIPVGGDGIGLIKAFFGCLWALLVGGIIAHISAMIGFNLFWFFGAWVVFILVSAFRTKNKVDSGKIIAEETTENQKKSGQRMVWGLMIGFTFAMMAIDGILRYFIA